MGEKRIKLGNTLVEVDDTLYDIENLLDTFIKALKELQTKRGQNDDRKTVPSPCQHNRGVGEE